MTVSSLWRDSLHTLRAQTHWPVCAVGTYNSYSVCATARTGWLTGVYVETLYCTLLLPWALIRQWRWVIVWQLIELLVIRQMILSQRLDPNILNEKGATPLHSARTTEVIDVCYSTSQSVDGYQFVVFFWFCSCWFHMELMWMPVIAMATLLCTLCAKMTTQWSVWPIWCVWLCGVRALVMVTSLHVNSQVNSGASLEAENEQVCVTVWYESKCVTESMMSFSSRPLGLRCTWLCFVRVQ